MWVPSIRIYLRVYMAAFFLVFCFSARSSFAERLINCHDVVYMQASVCSDPQILTGLNHLKKVYASLRSARDPVIAELAGADEAGFTGSLDECRLPDAFPSLPQNVKDCVLQVVAEQEARITAHVARHVLVKDIIQHGFLHPGLVVKFPDFFENVRAHFVGVLTLHGTDNDHALRGKLVDPKGNNVFPALYEHSTPTDVIFFTVKCRGGCAAWWDGHFKQENRKLNFILDHRL